MIQLHAPFLSRNPASRGRILSHSRAAIQVLGSVDVSSTPFLDSFIGVSSIQHHSPHMTVLLSQ